MVFVNILNKSYMLERDCQRRNNVGTHTLCKLVIHIVLYQEDILQENNGGHFGFMNSTSEQQIGI